MVHNCCVKGCGSVWLPGSLMVFHAFPLDVTRREQWKARLELKSKFYNSAKICSLHFKESDYDHTGKRLKPTAIPFNYDSKELETESPDTPTTNESRILRSHLTKPKTPTTNTENANESSSDESFQSSSSHTMSPMNDKALTTKPLVSLSTTHNGNQLILNIEPKLNNNSESEKEDSDSSFVYRSEESEEEEEEDYTGPKAKESVQSPAPAPIEVPFAPILDKVPLPPTHKNHPETLKKRISFLSRKVKIMQQKLKRRELAKPDRKIARILKNIDKANPQQNVIEILKQLKNYTQQSEMENILNGNFKKLCASVNKNGVYVNYSDEVIKFAITLNYYSPKAFNFVRKHIPLPSVQMLQRYAEAGTYIIDLDDE